MKNNLKTKIKTPEFRQKFSSYILPMLLGTAVCFSITYTLYEAFAVPYTILFFFLEYLWFSLFDKIKKRKILGGIIYTVILFALFFISMMLVFAGMRQLHSLRSPILWFFGNLDEEEQPLFFNALYIGGGFFIISIIYYFTQIRYRTLGVMLCILFPFVIYARRSETMPEVMVTIIVLLYVSVIVHNKLTDPAAPKRNKIILKTDRQYIISILVFVSITGTVTMLIPKPSYTSQFEKNADYLSYTQIIGGAGDGTSVDSTSDVSSPRYGARNYSGSVLFNFVTDGSKQEYYLRKNSFQKFNGDVWEVVPLVNPRGGMYYTSNPEYSTDDILSDSKEIFKNGIAAKIQQGRVYSESFSAHYLPAPFGTVTDDQKIRKYMYAKFENKDIYRRYYTKEDAVLNDDFEFFEQGRDIYEYAQGLGLSSADYFQALMDNGSEAAQRLYEDYFFQMQNYTDTDNISTRVEALANEITDEYHSDIDKALALEQYFEKNGYVYDESYIPEDQSIEYFIFEGKTGVCTNYATAMTIMARSVGLTAKYVEGFAAFEKNEEGEFIIRDKYAHAFVEVYIPGAGWLTFDPTVSSYKTLPEYEDDSNFLYDFLNEIIKRFWVIIITAIIIILIYVRDIIFEIFFRFAQIFRSPKEKTLKLYAHLIKVLNFSTNEKYDSYTVNMLEKYISTTRGNAPEKLLILFEKTAFGKYEPTQSEYHSAYTEYKKCWKYLRKIPKKVIEKH